MQTFASDNNSGIHPAILAAIEGANHGQCRGYGEDRLTKEARAAFRRVFGADLEVFLVMTGTAANTLALNTVPRSYNAVICAETAHIFVDECGATEKFCGCKLLKLPTADGRIHIAQIEPCLEILGDVHHSQPAVVSITQPTEYGTLYTVQQIS